MSTTRVTDGATKGTTQAEDLASELRATRAALKAATDVLRASLEPRPRLLTVEQVGQALQVSKSTICKLIREGLFPEPMKVAGLSRWRRKDIDLYVDRRGQWGVGKWGRSRG